MDSQLKKQIADELEVEIESLRPNTNLKDLEYWDSVMALTVMTLIEISIGMPVSPEDFSNVVTFGDIEKLVENTINSR